MEKNVSCSLIKAISPIVFGITACVVNWQPQLPILTKFAITFGAFLGQYAAVIYCSHEKQIEEFFHDEYKDTVESNEELVYDNHQILHDEA